MSGQRRAILAEIMNNGLSSEAEIKKAFSPEAIRSETGRSNMNGGIVVGEDKGNYLGKQGQDATK